jgi:hypothetical protein
MFFPSFRENLAHSEARGFFIFTPHRLGIPALNRHRKNQVLAQFVLSGMGVLPVNHAQMRVPRSNCTSTARPTQLWLAGLCRGITTFERRLHGHPAKRDH